MEIYFSLAMNNNLIIMAPVVAPSGGLLGILH